jgi:hypothetical protein
MLALNRSLLNREYILMNILQALASIISKCNLHVILLSKITPRYFMLYGMLLGGRSVGIVRSRTKATELVSYGMLLT